MHTLDIYHYPIGSNDLPKNLGVLKSVLDDYEQKRYERYKFEHARLIFATSRYLLKTKLAEQLSIEPKSIFFQYNENGKPSIDDSCLHLSQKNSAKNIQFSLSHTKTSIAFAISRLPVGIDVEQYERRGAPWDNARDFINEHAEKHILASPSLDEKKMRFARYWTAMEAEVKFYGSGIFKVKEQFAENMSPLIQDGVYRNNDLLILTGRLSDAEHISICSQSLPEKVRCFEHDKKSWKASRELESFFSSHVSHIEK